MRRITNATITLWLKDGRDPALSADETFVTLKCPACSVGRATIDDMTAECTDGCTADSITAALSLPDLDAVTPPATGYWPPPVPLERRNLPPFPVSVLPAWLANYAAALASETQTPVDLAAMLSLG